MYKIIKLEIYTIDNKFYTLDTIYYIVNYVYILKEIL